MQAILFTVSFLNDKDIFKFIMDISPDNLALRFDGHRIIISILDSGGCVVVKETTHAPMAGRNTSMAATGAVAAHPQIHALPGKVDGVCFLSPTFVRNCYRNC